MSDPEQPFFVPFVPGFPCVRAYKPMQRHCPLSAFVPPTKRGKKRDTKTENVAVLCLFVVKKERSPTKRGENNLRIPFLLSPKLLSFGPFFPVAVVVLARGPSYFLGTSGHAPRATSFERESRLFVPFFLWTVKDESLWVRSIGTKQTVHSFCVCVRVPFAASLESVAGTGPARPCEAKKKKKKEQTL